jgi:hypothetical protein
MSLRRMSSSRAIHESMDGGELAHCALKSMVPSSLIRWSVMLSRMGSALGVVLAA